MYDVYVSLGTKNESGRGSKKSEQIRVVEAFCHPIFRMVDIVGMTHDVGVFKLEKPSKHQPARLPATDGSDNKPGTMATVLGWGMVNSDTSSQTLRVVDFGIITNEKCDETYNDATVVDDSVMCAGDGNGKDSCDGDSGGPLIANGTVVGIVSSGAVNCGELPGTYARVSYASDFIDEILNGGSVGNVTEVLTAGESIFDMFESGSLDTSQIQRQTSS
ncbi:hypothetical protein PHYPSEUDO_014199 [Phytophthora pseudosyringae]|uniref:Peptidase S1 domain-containing protein n=1 Tax=Phytophthora pseudosyringae TaxID=221518 RepID=A0A8T1V7U8_9STRA|nr:hypothetical protein PHYPSEUDO_014199 [Phytophthora pseudosyringae]